MRAFAWFSLVFAVFGCSNADGPLARAADAEASGKLTEAKTLYAEACANNPATCDRATPRVARVGVKLALVAIDEGRFVDAKKVLDEAAGSGDEASKQAATRALQSPDLIQGLIFEEASALKDDAAALAKMEAVAATTSASAAKARAWIVEKKPGILIAAAKAACKKDGVGSCIEATRALAKFRGLVVVEAAMLEAAEYARVQSLLVDAEHLLVQELELWQYEDRIHDCISERLPTPGEDDREAREACAQQNARPLGTEGAIESAWKAKMEAIHDPARVKAFDERRKQVSSAGIYDPASWPKPPKG